MTSSSITTAFVLVPGGFCPGSFWHKVTERLRNKGFAVTEINLPSVGNRDQPPATMYEDAAAVRSAAAAYMDDGKNVIVATNSYGGFLATEAMKGLSDSERGAAGKSGGRIANLVYIGTLLPVKGLTFHELLAGSAKVTMPYDTDFLDPPPLEAAATLMSDLPMEEVTEYGKQMECFSTIALNQKLTHEGWQHVPVTFIVTENDKTLPSEKQHESVDSIIADGKTNIKKISLDSDHCAMISHPEEVSVILLAAAE